jgi:phosphoglycolate phosphatase-like HAD superfamily hydrolase
MPSADDATLPAPGLVIFDCDGVLVDSERISHLVLQAMLAAHGALLAALTTPRCVASNGPPQVFGRMAALPALLGLGPRDG